MDIQSMNKALAEALGVTDTKHTYKIVLTIEPGKLPELVVTKRIVAGDLVYQALQPLQLEAVAPKG